MSRKIFFSFHFGRDAWRAGQVRNSDLLPNEDEVGFIDKADWEEVKRKGDASIRNWIDAQLDGTSATVVLIGAETAQRPWVEYEIRESWRRGNAIVGVYIHNVKNEKLETDAMGPNPLDRICLADGRPLSAVCKTYDWVLDDGRNNLGAWADLAVKERASYSGETRLSGGDTLAGPATSAWSASGGFIPKSPHSN